ncbi:MAG: hypothetical protein RR544_08055 [Oscillospiraceae bacterium]
MGMITTKISIDKTSKTAIIWVPNGTAEAEVQRKIRAYAPHYFVAVMRSGTGDLVTATQDLLRANLI